ncbi:hypothetical protein [Atlantibacter hermannii]|uniref:hypothetical protein n=1 Tax=Atlantibacter hermannii TaxID=565 RepID=UPI00331BD358
MSKILYWHVKIYHRIFTGFNGGGFGGCGGSGSNMYGHEKLFIEGYSKDKPHIYLGDNQTIELLTDPHGLETTAVSTATVERIVSTPVYEETASNKELSCAEMTEYIKAAIGEGYQPEHEAAITDLSVIDALSENALNREYGKCWQWYNMGGGMPFTLPPRKAFELAAEPLMKYLAENHNPHTTAIVNPTEAELVTGEMSHCTDKFLKD